MTLINQTPLLALKVVIDLGLGLDEPIAFQPAAPAAEPPTAPAAELTPNRPKPDIGTGLDWQTAATAASPSAGVASPSAPSATSPHASVAPRA
jgi:hypothetical protein